MGTLSRIGVAIETNLLVRFDRFIASQCYANRSEGFRDLVPDRLVCDATEDANASVVGSVNLIYDHQSRLLPEKLQHGRLVMSSPHALVSKTA
jgi:CopG family nickel-responsive transcriptional regulator